MKLYIRNTSNPLLPTAIQTVKENARKAANHFGFKGQVVSTWSAVLYDRRGAAGAILGETLEDGLLEAIIYLGETALLCPPYEDKDSDGLFSQSQWEHTAEHLIGFIKLVFAKDGSVTITAFKTATKGLFTSPTPDQELQVALNP